MKVKIETVPHKDQRYETCGDWYFDDKTLVIRVSDLGDWRAEALVAVHELVEALLCMNDGVDEHDVTEFDIAFEQSRVEGNIDEPGEDLDAPYREQHAIADVVERLLATAMGIPWKHYNELVANSVADKLGNNTEQFIGGNPKRLEQNYSG